MKSRALSLFFFFIFYWLVQLSDALGSLSDQGDFFELPSQFRSQELSLSSRSMGELCESISIFSDGTVCNPAYLTDVEESHVLVRVFIGNGYRALSTANQILNEKPTQEFLKNLFQNENVTTLEGQASLAFTTKYFSASYVPYRVQFFSEVHDPAYPIMAIHAAREQSLNLDAGIPLDWAHSNLSDFSLGAHTQWIDRTFVHSTFTLFDVLTNGNPAALASSQSQKVIKLEPSLAWQKKDVSSNIRALRMGTTLRNLRWVNRDVALYSEKTDIDFGVGIEPNLSLGRLQFGLDSVSLMNAPTIESRFRFGGSYTLGMTSVMTGVTSSAVVGGIQFHFGFAQVGVAYEFYRKELHDGNLERQISTEFGVQL